MAFVRKSGCKPPVEAVKEVDNQIQLRHKYHNVRTELEAKRRDMIREVEKPFGIDMLYEEEKLLKIEKKKLKDSKTTSKSEKAENRSRTKEIEARVKEIKISIKEIRDIPELVEKLEAISGKRGEKVIDEDGNERDKSLKEKRADKKPNNSIFGLRVKATRAEWAKKGLFWGNSQLTDKALQAAFKVPMYDGKKANNPEFQKWNFDGQVGIQIQKSTPTKKRPESIPMFGADLFGSDSRVSIEPIDEDILVNGKRCERRKEGRTFLTMRVSSNVCAKWPIVIHRPIPKDARVTWVTVSRRKVGARTKWTCEITLEDNMDTRPAPTGVGTAAVVFGWRKHGKRVRVAQWMSTTGDTDVLELLNGELTKEENLSEKDTDRGYGGVIDGIRKVHDLSSIRDKNFNEARTNLTKWLSSLKQLPEWMLQYTSRKDEDSATPSKAQAISYIRQWKSQKRLASLTRKWRDNRFEGDEVGYNALEKWRYNDYHLWNWERSQSVTSRRRRTDIYRNFAAGLTSNFSRLLIDGTNFKQVKEIKVKDKTEGRKTKKPQTMGQMVAVGELREKIKCAAGRRGCYFEKLEASKSALRCPRCGKTDKAHREEGVFACSYCTYSGDVTTTRLLNMLAKDGFKEEVLEIIKRKYEVVQNLRGIGARQDEHPEDCRV